MWTRRKFIETSIVSQIAISSGGLNFLYSCIPGESSLEILDPEIQKILSAAIDVIIPAGDGMPAASDVGGLNYLLRLLEKIPAQTITLSAGLSTINKNSIKKFNKDFTKITSEERVSLLTEEEKSNTAFFNQLRDFTYESYYLSPQVWKLMGYEPHTTMSAGPYMEAFDERLLDRVRSMQAMYRDV